MSKNGITTQEREKALLVSVYTGGPQQRSECDEHLEELALLVETYGAEVAHKIPCQLRKHDASTYVTAGKLEEIEAAIAEIKPNVLIFDDEITPSQQKVLQERLKIKVMDRTGVILEVFGQRAQTSEARLQVELAKVKYQAPRLKYLWTHLSRQQGTGGGGVYLKGEGEKQIELDRRMLKDRISLLQKEIEGVRANRAQQRAARYKSGIPTFAIIGYTNAGKSTLLNALTDANVFVEDKLFATLDTTTRKFTLPNNQDVLIIDTVGFIRKLPHLLVAAFRSTLEESLEADILLHLVDVSNPAAVEQAATTYEVLKELGVKNKPIITVLNKIDQCPTREPILKLKVKYPHTVSISALKREGFEELVAAMVEELGKQRRIVELRIPQSEYAVVSEVMRLGHVLNREYEENDVLIKVELPSHIAGKMHGYIQS
jgi:GTP-binding protein HflX